MDKQSKKELERLQNELDRLKDEQGRKIDILCNDMVSAHREFASRISSLAYAVDFYETLLDERDLSGLLKTAAGLIKANTAGLDVAIFLLGSGSFEVHMVDENSPIEIDASRFESCFDLETVSKIARSNRICFLNDMLKMGLEADLALIDNISAAAVGFGRNNFCKGFVLVHRSGKNGLSAEDAEKIVAVMPGLSRAIAAFGAASKVFKSN